MATSACKRIECQLRASSGTMLLCYLQFPPESGGQYGGGAPSNEKAGTVNAVYVQSRPTIRNNILIARFMEYSPCFRVPWERKP